MPLGTIVEITAEVESGRARREKATGSHYLLKVTQVDDRVLRQPIVLPFTVHHGADVPLASDPLGLYRLKYGKDATRLDDAQMDAMENGYVGQEVRLSVYETGGFSGIPKKLPRDLIYQGRPFAFSTKLVVLKELN